MSYLNSTVTKQKKHTLQDKIYLQLKDKGQCLEHHYRIQTLLLLKTNLEMTTTETIAPCPCGVLYFRFYESGRKSSKLQFRWILYLEYYNTQDKTLQNKKGRILFRRQ